jgi:glycosyltransferase involved in cell wall biosynthesis
MLYTSTNNYSILYLMPIRVLMFGWELPPYNSGGLGTACYGLSQALADQNIEITFVLPKKVNVKADFMRLVFGDIDGFNWPDFNPYETLKLLPPGIDPELVRDLLSAVSLYAKRAAAIAKNGKYDLIHSHDWLCFPAGIVASEVSRAPLITHVHATEMDRSGGNSVNPMVYAVEKHGMDKSSAVIAVSQFTKNLLKMYYQVHPEKINVIHNGVNAADFDIPVDEANPLQALKDAGFKIVSFVGRLTLQKGPDYLLKAAKRTLEYYPNVVFLFVGSGDMEGQLINQAVQMGLSDKVLFAGFLRGKMLSQAFKAADLFVMPSVSEPFGITALESVASGTPAIISKQSGASEALGHVLKVDFWDVEEMANQIISTLNYPSLHKSLKDNGKNEVKKVSWQAAAAKTIDVYKKVLSGVRN